MTQTPTHVTHIQSTTGTEHQLTARNMAYILSINTDNFTQTPTTNDHDGRQPHSKLLYQRNQSGQPLTKPKENQQTNKTVSNIRYAEPEYTQICNLK
jgi:hypothetical protein